MAFGGGTGIKTDPPKPLGIGARRTSTHEQARPVPYFAGITRMGATFISDPWNVKTQDVTSSVGKDNKTVGYIYTASFAVLFSVGAVDLLKKIYLDDDLAWDGAITRAPGEIKTTITVVGFGTIKFYWGGEDQGIDSDLAASGVDHPGYRGQCYAVFVDWILGQDRTTVNNIEVFMSRTPVNDWLADCTVGDDVNPMLPFYEWWTNPRWGLGLSRSYLNLSKLAATAATLVAEGMGISPLVTSQTTLGNLVAQTLDHIDGYIAQDPDGLWYIGLNRPPTDEEFSALAEIGTADLMDIPKLGTTEWASCINQVFVRFPNKVLNFDTDAISWRERANFEIVGGNRSMTVTREWVTKQKVAWAIAGSLCRQDARPYVTGSINVRWSKGVNLTPGKLFLLTYARANISSMLCRVDEQTFRKPDDSQVSISFVEDRSALTIAATDIPEDSLPDADSYDTVDIYGQWVQELPYAYMESDGQNILFLPARGSTTTKSFNAYYESSPASFSAFGGGSVFSRKGVIETAWPADRLYRDTIRMRVTLSSPDDTVPDCTLADAVERGTVLVFVGNEILRAYTPQLVAANTWAFYVLRGAFGSIVENHAVGAPVFIVKDPTREASHWSMAATPAGKTFKIQAVGLGGDFPLEDCTEIPYTITRRSTSTLAPTSVTVNGPGVATYASGTDIVVDWTSTGDLWEKTDEDTFLNERADSIAFEFLTTGGVSIGVLDDFSPGGPHTISNADLVAVLGSEISFILRARFVHDAIPSIGYSQVQVTKV